MKVRFAGWIEYEPSRFHAELIVTGHAFLPDGARISLDTAMRLKIPYAHLDIPDLYKWRRARYALTKRVP